METAAEIWADFQARRFHAAVLVIMLLVSGWAQQTQPAVQEHESIGKQTKTIEYKNSGYGFSLRLPELWKGYRVSWSEWEGSVLRDDGSVTRELRGPKLRIRHPKWT